MMVPNRSSRRRSDLILSLPQRDPSLAVPLPLPPSSHTAPSTSHHQTPEIILSELHRVTRIGSGSGGTVYKVVHRPTNGVYALKVIYGNHEESVRKQICREIEILRGVRHSNVVKCHEMFDHNGEIQLLLEFMDGGSLEGTQIGNERDLSKVAYQVLRGIAYLHGIKIVHRDIKPSNLLINANKDVKIADFGVSRILSQTMDPCNSSVGTIAYMSPERINPEKNDGQYDGYAGDIWGLGVSILELYVGRFPFAVERQGDWSSLMCAISLSPPPVPPPSASLEFKHFMQCCLQKDPTRRRTAMDLLNHPFIVMSRGSHVEVNQNLRQLFPLPSVPS